MILKSTKIGIHVEICRSMIDSTIVYPLKMKNHSDVLIECSIMFQPF